MITTRSIEGIISLIIIIIAYALSGTLAGFSQAWVANNYGDDSGKNAGLLTLNPLEHIDLIGMFFLLVLKLGWTRHVPIDPTKYRSPFHLIIASCTNTMVYVLIAFISLLLLELTFGLVIVPIAIAAMFSNALFSGAITVSHLAAGFPTHSSFVLLCGFCLMAMLYLCTLLAALDAIITTLHLAVRFHAPDLLYNPLFMFGVSFACILIFGGILHALIGKTIVISAITIAQLLGF